MPGKDDITREPTQGEGIIKESRKSLELPMTSVPDDVPPVGGLNPAASAEPTTPAPAPPASDE